MFYKIHYNLVAITRPLSSKLYSCSTRTAENILAYNILSSRCDYHLYLFFPRIVRDWNTLPQQTVQLRTVEAFKQAIVTARSGHRVLHCKMVFYSVGSSDPTQRSWTMFLTCTCTCTCTMFHREVYIKLCCTCYLILPLSWLPVQLCHTITHAPESSSY